MPKKPGVPSEKIMQWCHEGVPELLGWVVASFPNSKVAFRTPPTMKKPQFGRNPDALAQMSNCIKEELDGKFDVLDFHAIIDDMLADGIPIGKLFKDPTHPSRKPTLNYLNEILNYVREMQ